jgi:hypothetical protein
MTLGPSPVRVSVYCLRGGVGGRWFSRGEKAGWRFIEGRRPRGGFGRCCRCWGFELGIYTSAQRAAGAVDGCGGEREGGSGRLRVRGAGMSGVA